MQDGKKNRVMKIINIVLVILILGLLCTNGYTFYQLKRFEPIHVIEIHDTVFRDSIQIKEKTKWIYRSYVDTIILHTIDSINITDTIILPIDHYNYKDTIKNDSLDIRLDIGYQGYKAAIDSIKIDYDLHYTVREPRESNFKQYIGIGINAGYGMSLTTEAPIFSPQIGISVQYGFGYCFKRKRQR